MFRRSKKQTGFTIAELTIASAIFSVVLLVALAGFMQIGHIFYKGVTITSTQETANQIYKDVSGYFQTATSITLPPAPVNGYSYYCIGGARFTYNIDKAVDTSQAPDHSATGNFGILKDVLLAGPAACSAPCNDLVSPATCSTPFSNPQELLGDKMRVLKFGITPGSQSNLFDISMMFAYGDDEVLGYQTPGVPTSRYCLAGSANQQFCSIVNEDGSVFRGFQ
jgi:prepilin-type N-terminal cleavage/methylation domain-containing protein